MAQNETPQTITREEFEAGVKFYLKDELQNYKLEFVVLFEEKNLFIVDYNNRYYCSVESITDTGFQFGRYVFNHKITNTILFKDCIKSLNQ